MTVKNIPTYLLFNKRTCITNAFIKFEFHMNPEKLNKHEIYSH